jgi:hypothetical protein
MSQPTPVILEWFDKQTDPKTQVASEIGKHGKKHVVQIGYHNPCTVRVTHKDQTICFETNRPNLAKKLAEAAYNIMLNHKLS